MSDIEEESQCEWFTVCDEKNILLEKNENNLYKITFNVKTNDEEDTVLNVLKNGQLFELLSALNPDVIKKINVKENNDNIHHVLITFKNLDDEINSNKDDNILNIHFYLKYKFKEGKCVITSQKKQNKNNIKTDNNDEENKDSLFISQIKLKAVEKNKKTSIYLILKLDNVNTSNFINMYIGLYFKKIFHRFKQYFE
jgi:hypothetical protein